MKNHIKRGMVILGAILLLSVGRSAGADDVSQSFNLTAGWNAIFLEVEPPTTDPGAVFADITQLQSVWMWNPRTRTVEFIQNPDNLLPDDPQWMVYYPGDPPLPVNNLLAINGGKPYLIKVGRAQTWQVTGIPCIPEIEWKPNALNFVGFHRDEGKIVYFEDFFSSSGAHAGQDIYVLNNDEWEKVTAPSVTPMNQGQAFWIYCDGTSTFTGPISVQLEQGRTMDFGKTLSEQNLRLHNSSPYEKTISLSTNDTDVPLFYWEFNPAENEAGWAPFSSLGSLNISAAESQKIRIGVKRAGINPGEIRESNIIVSDISGSSNSGIKIRVPISVEGIDLSGLWVGNATINEVSNPSDVINPLGLKPTGSEFSLRLILHVDELKKATLLSHVIQMWNEGTWKPDPTDMGKDIVDQPGEMVLFTDESLIQNYTGAALRGGKPVGRRISSPAFPRLNPDDTDMGTFDITGGTVLTEPITMDRDDPVNPFRHLFHPDHKLTAQSYRIERTVTLTMSPNDNNGTAITGVPTLEWGSSEAGGIYEEEITGLHREKLRIRGWFLLHKVCDVPVITQ